MRSNFLSASHLDINSELRITVNNIHACGNVKMWLILSKLSEACLTLSRVSELPAHYSSISTAPAIITHSTPHIVYTELHSALIWNIASNQSQFTGYAWNCNKLNCLLQHHILEHFSL